MTHPNAATLIHLADLALLDIASLSIAERENLSDALLQTTAWVSELMKVPTDGVSATVQPFGLPTTMRTDAAVTDVNSTDILALAPDRHGEFFRVPRVVGTEAPEDHTDVPEGNCSHRTQGHE